MKIKHKLLIFSPIVENSQAFLGLAIGVLLFFKLSILSALLLSALSEMGLVFLYKLTILYIAMPIPPSIKRQTAKKIIYVFINTTPVINIAISINIVAVSIAIRFFLIFNSYLHKV